MLLNNYSHYRATKHGWDQPRPCMQFRCPRNRKMVFFSFVLFVSVNDTQSIRLSMSIWVLASCSVTPNPSPLRYCATMTCSLHYDVTHITRDISISHPLFLCNVYAHHHCHCYSFGNTVGWSGCRVFMGYEEVRQTINKLYGNTRYQN